MIDRGQKPIRQPLFIVAILLGTFALSGCAWLPSAGPSSGGVKDQVKESGRVALVQADVSVIDVLARQPGASFKTLFGGDATPPVPVIAVGDVVSVGIWEAGGGALFASSASASTSLIAMPAVPSSSTAPATIPDQLVGPDGTVMVPFAGRLQAVGRTPRQIEEDIRRSLTGKATNPQILVNVTKTDVNSVTVTGEVVQGMRVPLSPAGTRILDAVATAGGLKAPTYETYVRLTRSAVTATVPFTVLLSDPAQNIRLWPGDILTVVHGGSFFEAFGATGRNEQLAFGQEDLSLADAMGKAAGLSDSTADPAGVFVLRFEPPNLVRQIAPSAPHAGTDLVPVIYHFDFSNIGTYFLAQRFQMRNHDVIYIANSRSNGLRKFFELFGTIVSPVVTGAAVNNSVR